MALISRLTRLFEADFHAVLDRIEEPELQLRQAVREMQLALDQERQRFKLLQHEGEQLVRAETSLAAALEHYEAELDLCLAAGKDDLARDLLRRRLTDEKRLEAIRQQAATIESRARELAADIGEQDRQLASMKQKLELLATEEPAFAATAAPVPGAIREEEIEIALLREKQRRTGS